MFSIVIPSWNNLAYLELCVEALRRHSARAHQIIVHVNDGSDGTRDWIAREGLEHTASRTNVGVCYAVNAAAARARTDYVLYLNDDMVAAPGWDVALEHAMARVPAQAPFLLSGTMIEASASHNRCAVFADFGADPQHFDLDEFARGAPGKARADWLGATWPPTLVSRELWQSVGGFSVEFSPGMSSDNDFAMKLWHAGCRVFLGIGDSLFYHFAKVSTARIDKNDGRRQFRMKWGMTQSAFDRYYLRRGDDAPPRHESPVLSEPEPSLRWRMTRIKNDLLRRFGS